MKLLVVDDDRQICEGVKMGINWSEIGIDEVLTAFNGIEAMEIFKGCLPEIVLTDIRMPGMDGLALFREIKKIRPATKVIIISGYSDFEYLKTAIQYGAVDYELKPIRVKNLIALIQKVKEGIYKERKTEESFARYRSSHIARFMADLLAGGITDRNIILEALEHYFNFDARGFMVLTLWEKDSLGADEAGKTDDMPLLKEAFREKPEGAIDVLFWQADDRHVLVMIKTMDSMLYQQYLFNELKALFHRIGGELPKNRHISLSAGVSSAGAIGGIAALYREAVQALESKFYTGKGQIHFYRQEAMPALVYRMPAAFAAELGRTIDSLDMERARRVISKEFNDLWTEKAATPKSVKDFSLELISFLNSTLKSKGYASLEAYDEQSGAMARAAGLDIEALRRLVLDYYSLVFQGLQDEKKVFNNKCMLKALEMIKRAYREDLTVEKVAAHIGKSPNYFSHVFKKEMQMSFTEYLNRLRIRKARELIACTDKRIQEVCQEVGYQDYAYFAKLFKKYERCTPTEAKSGV